MIVPGSETGTEDVYVIEPMVEEDIAAVSKLERRCFTNPWPQSAYRRELRNPDQNFYIVLRDVSANFDSGPGGQSARRKNGNQPAVFNRLALLSRVRRGTNDASPMRTNQIVGFAGFWHVFDEAHITTIAVDPELRGQSLGELLLVAMIEEASVRGAGYLSLEVRISNNVALRLYEKYGFITKGVRPRYYIDDGEDAYVMWSPNIRVQEFRTLVDERRLQLRESLDESTGIPERAPGFAQQRQSASDGSE